MSATSNAPLPDRPPWGYEDSRRWVHVGLAVLLALIAAAVALSIAAAVLNGVGLPGPAPSPPWDWIVGLIGVVIAIWLVVWIVRFVLWGLAGDLPPGRYYRRYYRRHHHDGIPGIDPATAIARERFARGEISSDQLAQILRTLEAPTGPA